MNNYYDELLKLCGFDDNDIESEKPRLDKAFQKIELGSEDMDRAVAFVKEYHDVELVGVRKLMRAWLLELVDMVLARDEGKKIVYFGYPSISPGPGQAIKAAAPDKIYAGAPDVVLCNTLGQIFDMLGSISEAGEENGLPPGHGLCSLLTVRVGGMAKGIIPIPDLVIGASYSCDMGSKADELLHEKYGHRAIYMDGSLDSAWGEYPEFLPERVRFLGAQMDKVPDIVKEVIGVEITSEAWDRAMEVGRHFYRRLGQLTELMASDPLPVGPTVQTLALHLMSGCTGRAMADGPEAMDILIEEVKQRVDKGIGVVEKGAPRVLITLTHMSDPRIARMIEQAGLAAICSGHTAPPRLSTRKEKAPEGFYTTLGELRAETEMRDGRWHSSYATAIRTPEIIMALKPDGVIASYLYCCRPAALGSHNYKIAAEKTGIPHLQLEVDLFDSRNYSAEALRTRVETFADMLRDRKAAAQ
ncbi:2-hydroxyacyl-CoA dehydratase [Chloroflexota bacterium]